MDIAGTSLITDNSCPGSEIRQKILITNECHANEIVTGTRMGGHFVKSVQLIILVPNNTPGRGKIRRENYMQNNVR